MFVLRWLQAGCVQFLGGGDGLCTWLNHKVQNGTWSALSKKDSHRQAWSAERVGLRREETDHCPHEEGDLVAGHGCIGIGIRVKAVTGRWLWASDDQGGGEETDAYVANGEWRTLSDASPSSSLCSRIQAAESTRPKDWMWVLRAACFCYV